MMKIIDTVLKTFVVNAAKLDLKRGRVYFIPPRRDNDSVFSILIRFNAHFLTKGNYRL
jgi:hypothetical protein